jgi:LysM repeat protein
MSPAPTNFQPSGLVPRVVRTARAGADPVDVALQAALATRDPKKVQAQVDVLARQVLGLKAAKQDSSAAEAALAKARQRLAALPYLNGLPDLPKPAVGRNPVDSSSFPTGDQGKQARAWLDGYTGKTSFLGNLARKIPFLARFFPVAQPTPEFKKLSAADQAKVLDLARTANAAGQIALHELLTRGKLTPSLLDALQGLANDRLDPKIDQRQLVSQALIELNDPVSISQKSRGTCAPTSVQILIALREPQVYVGLLRGLASPSGLAKLPNGAEIRREADWSYDNDGGRSIPSRLLQPALMEFANGDADYDNTNDMDVDPKTHQTTPSGLDGPGAAKLLTAVMEGAPAYQTLGVTYNPDLDASVSQGLDDNIESPRDLLMLLEDNRAIDAKSQDALLAQLAAHATPADPVYCTMIYTLRPSVGGVGFHAILVTGVKDDHVSYINPWGQEESLPAAVFKRAIVSANVRQDGQVDQPAPGVGGDVKPASAPDTYVVQPGDTLSKLAQRYLGKASRWREIARLNPGHGEKLVPGRSIRLPERT